MKIVFLNGPPGSGKDTAADQFLGRYRAKFAAPTKAMVCGGLGVTLEWLEENKDKPHPALNGETPRKFLIRLSEDFIKPIYGDQFFGKVMVELLKKFGDNAVVFITDSGFLSEAIPVVAHVGIENCLKIELYRKGKDFKNDSRSYWHMDGLATRNVHNDLTTRELMEQIHSHLRDKGIV